MNLIRAGMRFDGGVGDLGSRDFNGIVYEKTYTGKGTQKAFEKFLKKELKIQGVECVGIKYEDGEAGTVKAVVKIRSFKGIV